MATKIQLRRDTASAWASANPVLSQGEFGFVTDTHDFKLGDGSTPWNSLDVWPNNLHTVKSHDTVTLSGTQQPWINQTGLIQGTLNRTLHGAPRAVQGEGVSFTFNAFNSIILQDQVVLSNDGDFVYGLQVSDIVQAPATGLRCSIFGSVSVQSAGSGQTQTATQYVGVQGYAEVSTNLGGTAPTAGGSRGSCWGGIFFSAMRTGATNQISSIGLMVDNVIESGASVYDKTGLMIRLVGNDAVRGAGQDAGFNFVKEASAGSWQDGILFGWNAGGGTLNYLYWPFASDSTLISVASPGSGSHQANIGIDFTNLTLTGPAFKTGAAPIALSEMATPPSAVAGEGQLYVASDGSLHYVSPTADTQLTAGGVAGTGRTLVNVTSNTTISGTNGVDVVAAASDGVTVTLPDAVGNSNRCTVKALPITTVALLHCDGTNASTTFTDSSPVASNWTAVGSAQISTAQSQFGGASAKFSTSGSYVHATAASSNFTFGTADFTIEFWVYLNSTVVSNQILYDGRPGGATGPYIMLLFNSSGALCLDVYNSFVITGFVGILKASPGAWHHVALCRAGGNTILFLDGIQTGSTYADSNNYLNPGAGYPVMGSNFAGTSTLDGYLDEIRITKGYARYPTTPFTPPSGPFSASTVTVQTLSEVAMLHCDGADTSTTFNDSSPASSNWTAVGSAQISTAQSKFGGASAKFVTSGSYIKATDSSSNFAFGTGDFTIEFWLYLNATPTSNQTIYDGRPGSFGVYPHIAITATTPEIFFDVNANAVITSGAFSTGAWHHVAVCRVNGSTKLFIDGTQAGGTYSDSNNYLDPGAGYPSIGSTFAGSQTLDGYLDEIRITKGYGRYPSNFTPPSAPFNTFPQTIDGSSGPLTVASGSSKDFLPFNGNWITV